MLVNLKDYDIPSSNYYFHNKEKFNISAQELEQAKANTDTCFVEEEVAEALQKVDTELQAQGFQIYVKDGYRSPKLYQLAHQKVSEKYGNSYGKRLLNLEKMPHSTGYAVDVTLIDKQTHEEIHLRQKEASKESCAVDFYKDSKIPEEQQFQQLRKLMQTMMEKYGFKVLQREYRHFEYQTKQES